VGGSVSGLSGAGLVLQNNSGNNLAVAANGSFVFSAALGSGAAYNVTVLTQPTGPVQTCSVAAGSGTIGSANVTGVQVSCAASGPSVGGTVTGLESSGLVLQNNGGPDLAISANGAFTFPDIVSSGAAYAVTIKTQPTIGPFQNCTVTNGSGTVGAGPVTSVAIACVTRIFKWLYVPSQSTNSVSAFSINASDGSLSAVPGSPFSANGSPLIAMGEPSGRFLYVSNSGTTVLPSISGYSVNAATGALTELPTSPYDLHATTPPFGQIVLPVVHRSGAFAYAAAIPSGQLFGGTIDPVDGELTEIPGTPYATGSDYGGLSFDTAGQILFVANNASSGSGGRISSFQIHSPSGVLTPIGHFATGGDTPNGAFVTAQDDFLLAPNRASGTFTVFAVQKNSGTPTGVLQQVTLPPVATGPAGSQPIAIALNRRNNIFYVTNAGSGPTSIATFQLNASTGAVTPIGSPVPSNGATAPVFLHQSGRFLMQYNASIFSFQWYMLDQTTGLPSLSPTTFAPGQPAPYLYFVDVSGRYVYVLSIGSATLSSYSINQTTGALTLVNTVPVAQMPSSISPYGLQ
jgi:6-phosphogluconolactonase (cycloisomerase 2 family)